ncbi:MAG: ATP-binding cassette domain-containing protein, partial [Desulfobacteraceae bacterium]|nr:ATP-binding cassette domain-containing protein [Desulfobacteraceae bacterium]
MKIINAKSRNLIIDRFIAKPGEAWCLLGTNRSGIEDFFTLLTGEDPETIADLIDLPQNLGLVSFSRQQALFEEELKKDDTDFLDKIDPGTQACSFLENPGEHADLIRAFDMTDSMARGYRQLSTGQSRKLLLLAQITKGISWLAIQAPYEGLDPHSCEELDKAMAMLHQQGIGILILVHNSCDIPAFCTHLGLIANGRLDLRGDRKDIMAALGKKTNQDNPDFQASLKEVIMEQNTAESTLGTVRSESETKKESRFATELVRLKNGSAGYGGKSIFTGLDLSIHKGDHTLVTGSNGCGKSTLLQLITGDHPACYQNDLRIFGIQRGTGESIWELKRHMGIVSPDLHRNYYVPGTALHCILSGLFDSIGLYQKYTTQNKQQAEKWLERTGLLREAQTPFRNLTYANQRLVLIARALIKVPWLLILDEPTQGLDEPNRKAVLDFLE